MGCLFCPLNVEEGWVRDVSEIIAAKVRLVRDVVSLETDYVQADPDRAGAATGRATQNGAEARAHRNFTGSLHCCEAAGSLRRVKRRLRLSFEGICILASLRIGQLISRCAAGR